MSHADTIAAVATPPGVGGVGVIRLSGPGCRAIAQAILGRLPEPRHAHLATFRDQNGAAIDQGLALWFPAPRSFTGEDVLELQGHGGLVVMDLLLQRCLQLGARIAHPGEFSRRAFENGKMDLSQAEAVADLIESGAAEAARLALRTLQGEFSRRVHTLVEQLVRLRVYVEAAIDFPEEEIDFLANPQVALDLEGVIAAVEAVRASARTGALLRDGMTIVIAGRPNAGKSSLLNALAQRDAAIVTEVPGTTRDLLRERIQIDGLPIHLIDTAGLRETQDPVEQEGVRRARGELHRADRILWVYDAREPPAPDAGLPADIPLTLVRNKIDLLGERPCVQERDGVAEVALAARSGKGLEGLHAHLKHAMGYTGEGQGEFLARRRHLDALDRALAHLHSGQAAYMGAGAGELLADDLRRAQQALSEITGEFTTDDLLGAIFTSFCIGK